MWLLVLYNVLQVTYLLINPIAWASGKHLVQALLSVYALQCLNGKVDNKII